nr:hypothetical protein [Actinomadura rayongensis]
MEEIDKVNSLTSSDSDHIDRQVTRDVRVLRGTLFQDEAVRTVFERLYRWSSPGGSARRDLAESQWNDLDLESLTFYRRGTTSFLLRGRTRLLNDSVVVKCLIYPYTAIAPVSEECENYQAKYHFDQARFVPRLRASSPKWVIMDFVPGPTLREYVTEHRPQNPESVTVDLQLVREVSVAILTALDELDRNGLQHLDLTPSNIILGLEGDHVDQVTLIDMGKNHLYSRSVGLLEGPESIFVAPEIKRDGAGNFLADIYSLGLVVCWLADRAGFSGPVVPDVLYQQLPPLARFIDDMVDRDPRKRLLLADQEEIGSSRFRYIKQALIEEIDILEKADRVKPADERWLLAIVDLYRSRQPFRQYQIWHEERRRPNRHSRYAGWLLAWSAVCAANWYLVTAVVFIWTLRYWGVDSLPPAADVAGRLTGDKGFPVVDGLRAADYQLGFSSENVQTLVLALSFGLVATKYYQSIYANLTTRSLPGIKSALCEFFMRFNSCWVGGPILVAVLVNPAWWPWCAAIGYFGVALNDLFSHLVATGAIRRGSSEFSSIPAHTRHILRSHGEWWRTMTMYSLLLFLVAYCLSRGIIGDWWVYAAGIALVNVLKLYMSNTCRLAPLTRGALARSFAAGERLEALHSRDRRT